MPSPAIAFTLSGPLYGGSSVAPYQLMVQDGNGFYLPATTANRASYGRSKGMSLDAYGGNLPGGIRLQHIGAVDNGLNVGAGAADRWLRASATGGFEVFTPVNGGSSDIVGKAAADGSVTLELGIWTESMATGTGGGASPAGSDGNIQVKAGSVFGALAAGAGNIGKALVALTADTFGAGAIGLATSAVNGVLGLANGGTGLSTAGSDGQLLGTNGTAASWTNRLGRLLLGAAGASYPGSGFISLAYNSGVAQSIINGFDSTATIRDYLLHGPGDALTWGNGALDTIFKAGNSYLMTIGITGAIEATATAWGFALPVGGSSGYTKPFGFRSLVKDISAGGTITLTAAEAACPWIDFTGSPAATVDVVFPAGPSMYFLKNSASQAINIRKSGGSNLAMGSTGVRLVGCRDASSQYEFRSA